MFKGLDSVKALCITGIGIGLGIAYPPRQLTQEAQAAEKAHKIYFDGCKTDYVTCKTVQDVVEHNDKIFEAKLKCIEQAYKKFDVSLPFWNSFSKYSENDDVLISGQITIDEPEAQLNNHRLGKWV